MLYCQYMFKCMKKKLHTQYAVLHSHTATFTPIKIYKHFSLTWHHNCISLRNNCNEWKTQYTIKITHTHTDLVVSTPSFSKIIRKIYEITSTIKYIKWRLSTHIAHKTMYGITNWSCTVGYVMQFVLVCNKNLTKKLKFQLRFPVYGTQKFWFIQFEKVIQNPLRSAWFFKNFQNTQKMTQNRSIQLCLWLV